MLAVKKLTVEHLVKEELKEQVRAEDFHACRTGTCPVAYYSPQQEKAFYLEDIRVPLAYKEGARPRYICYCNKVSYEEVEEALIKKKARNLKDLIALTGVMKNAHCEENHPLGQ